MQRLNRFLTAWDHLDLAGQDAVLARLQGELRQLRRQPRGLGGRAAARGKSALRDEDGSRAVAFLDLEAAR